MRNRSLKKWAAIAEIGATIAVLVSLVFVVISIRQNTAQLRVQNENYMYELQNASLEAQVSNPWLADIFVKLNSDEDLTASEHVRYMAYQYQNVNRWEMAFYWFRQGQIEELSWYEWDRLFTYDLNDWLPIEIWHEMRPAYGADFAEHVDQAFRQSQ